MIRLCKKCGDTKPSSEFSVVTRTYKGLSKQYFQSACKACVVINLQKWRKEQPTRTPTERIKTRERGLEWNLTKNAVTWGAFKGESTIETHKVYPVHYCGRRYIESLGCLVCKRDALVIAR